MKDNDYRKDFLLELYRQLWNSINIRVNIIWESVGILVGAFAIFALTEKNIISFDVATTLIILLCGWFLAHIIDAAYWHNRNLVIIQNIEINFLCDEDLSKIHPYFKKHRDSNSMLKYMRIQFLFGSSLGVVIYMIHLTSVFLNSNNSKLCISNFFPTIVLLVVMGYLIYLKLSRNKKYKDLLLKSPGKNVSH